MQKELAALRGEKNHQVQLKTLKFNSLLVLRQIRGQFDEKEYQNYEGKLNTAASREEIEVIEKEILLKFKQKNTAPPKSNRENKDKIAEMERQNKILEGWLQLFNTEMEKLKGKIKNCQEQGNKDKILLVVVITILII